MHCLLYDMHWSLEQYYWYFFSQDAVLELHSSHSQLHDIYLRRQKMEQRVFHAQLVHPQHYFRLHSLFDFNGISLVCIYPRYIPYSNTTTRDLVMFTLHIIRDNTGKCRMQSIQLSPLSVALLLSGWLGVLNEGGRPLDSTPFLH